MDIHATQDVTQYVAQEDTQQPQMSAKDSLDRFGDDLCEDILSYLTLKDRFRCECVSKQWQRLVYTTVRNITITRELMARNKPQSDGYFYDKTMSALMKKCPNIVSIDCRQLYNDRHGRRILETIAELRDNCRHLQGIDGYFLRFDNDFVVYLFRTFGRMITELVLNGYQSRREVLRLCPNIWSLNVDDLSHVFTESGAELLAKNLKHFQFSFDIDFDISMFDIFLAYNQSLISVSQRLREIGRKCSKLKSFKLEMSSQTPQLNVYVLRAIPLMRRLKRLDLKLQIIDNTMTTDWHAFDCVSDWPKGLTHLCLDLWHIHFKLFRQLETNLRKLQSLGITTGNTRIHPEDTLDRISGLPKLQDLVIRSPVRLQLDDEVVMRFAMYSSPKLRSVTICETNDFDGYKNIWFGPMVTELCLRFQEYEREVIRLCPQLCRLKVNHLSHAFTKSVDKQLLAKNLRHIEFDLSTDFDISMFDTFVAHNQSLMSLSVRCIPKGIVNQFLTRITHLPQLHDLSLAIYGCLDNEYPIGDNLREIGIKCPKLKRFRLEMCSQTQQLNVDVLNAIPVMRRLKRLDLKLDIHKIDWFVITDWHAFESVSDWPKGLTHLSLDLWLIDNKLFQQIGTNLQKLQIIRISDPKSVVNYGSLDRISRLPKLQELVIRDTRGKQLDDKDMEMFARNSSPKLRSITISTGLKFYCGNVFMQFSDKLIHELRQ
ncbi:unnamed protein product [Oppiella nova]|uniref:F-box domain-containing protein n=1 Tax=Oppiella nova TaxID=334625 RepID=A0A7R9QIB0_9ACAR|nr:unnamed protein product [Oppiella nova]CAG2166405.1 unnamed protein product [Oppiella nova]